MGSTDQRADFGVHDQLGQHLHALAQEVSVAIRGCLAQQFERGHPVTVGHRVISFDVGFDSNVVTMARWPGAASPAVTTVTPTLGTPTLRKRAGFASRSTGRFRGQLFLRDYQRDMFLPH